jgi:hypothetical protein
MEDRYDKDSLSRFVRVTSKKNCLQQCHRKLDAWWLLKPMRKPKVKDWKSMPGLKTNVCKLNLLPIEQTPQFSAILSFFLSLNFYIRLMGTACNCFFLSSVLD